MAFIMNTLTQASLALIGAGVIYGVSTSHLTPVSAGLVGAVTGLLHTFGLLKGLLRWVLSGMILNVIIAGAALAYIKVYWTQPVVPADTQRSGVDHQEARTTEKSTGTIDPLGPNSTAPPRLRSTNAYTVAPRDKPIAASMTVRRTFDVAGREATSASGGAIEAESSSQGAARAIRDAWSNSRETPAAQALAAQAGSTQVPAATMSSKAYSMFSNAYKTIQDRSASPSGSGLITPKVYVQASDYTKDMWIKLDGSILFIYDDDTMSSPRGAIPVSEYTVTISNGSVEGAPKMKEGELFNKKNAIVLTPPLPPKRAQRDRTSSSDNVRTPTRRSTKSSLGGQSVESLPGRSAASILGSMSAASELRNRPRAGSSASSAAPSAEEEADARKRRQERRDRDQRRAQADAQPYYLFLKKPADMELWYHRLIQASARPPTLREIFPLRSWGDFVDELETGADPSQMRGLNAFIGRLFCAYSQTALIEAIIVNKIQAKIRKSNVHWMAGDITVREFIIGTHPPRFSKMVLKDINKEGGLTLQVDLNYVGEMSVQIGTQAQLSMGFKRVGFNVEAKATLRAISGTLVIQINPPPSNRLWYAFTKTPTMDLTVEPIISTTRLANATVLGQIDRLIRNAIEGAIVLPNMDDLSFFDTSGLVARGGIFDAAGRMKEELPVLVPHMMDGIGVIPTQRETAQLGADGGPGPLSDGIAQDQGTTDGMSPHKKTSAQANDSPKDFKDGIGAVFSTQSATGPARSGNGLRTEGLQHAAEIVPASGLTSSVPSNNNRRDSISVSSAPPSIAAAMPPTPASTQQRDFTTTSAMAQGKSPIRASLGTEPVRNSGPTVIQPPVSAGHRTANSTSSVTSAEAWSHPKPELLTGSSAAALMSSLRAKAADKEALQTSVNQARDAMKKWGTGWAAKHRLPAVSAPEGLTESESHRSAAQDSNIRPLAEGIRSALKDIPQPGDPFQRRLAAVALLATSPERPQTAQPQSIPAMAVPKISKRAFDESLEREVRASAIKAEENVLAPSKLAGTTNSGHLGDDASHSVPDETVNSLTRDALPDDRMGGSTKVDINVTSPSNTQDTIDGLTLDATGEGSARQGRIVED